MLFLSLPLILLQACNKSEEELSTYSECGQMAIVDKEMYDEVDSKGFEIKDVHLNGDCLTIEIVAGGCNGKSWEAQLIDGGIIAESYPVQRSTRIILENEETCLALVSRKFTFDLTRLQTGDGIVTLNLRHWKDQITYEYETHPQ